MEYLNWVLENKETVVVGALAIVGGFATLATLTANETDNKILNAILLAINMFGQNYGNAKNDPAL